MIRKVIDLAGIAFGACVLLLVLDAFVHVLFGLGYSNAWSYASLVVGAAALVCFVVMIVDDLLPVRRTG